MAFSFDPTNFLAEAAEFQAPSLMGGVGFGSNLVAPISNLGSEGLGQTPMREAAREYRFAGDALLARAQVEAEKKILKGIKAGNKAARSGQRKGGLFSSIGKFIVASNELSEQKLSAEEILAYYKDQSKVERGFRFLNDPLCMVESVFLKKESSLLSV